MAKFAHMSDIHLDSPFDYLDLDNKKDERRSEQRITFKNSIELADNSNCDFVVISGDLFDGEIADISTIKYIDEVFSMHEDMKFVLISGNHDLVNNNNLIYSYKFKSKNVFVLSNEKPSIIINDVKIYCELHDELDNNYYNILMWHGDVNESGQENPLPSIYKRVGFDYIALGHIHQFEDHSNEVSKIYYPGSLIARGFDELGKKGFLLVECNKENSKVSFVEVEQRIYINEFIDVSSIDYENVLSLANEISKRIVNPRNIYKFTLIGNRNSSTKINKIYLKSELANKAFHIKVKDETKFNETKELSLIEKEFVNKIDELIKKASTSEEKEKYQLAKIIGLKAFKDEVIFDEDM